MIATLLHSFAKTAHNSKQPRRDGGHSVTLNIICVVELFTPLLSFTSPSQRDRSRPKEVGDRSGDAAPSFSRSGTRLVLVRTSEPIRPGRPDSVILPPVVCQVTRCLGPGQTCADVRALTLLAVRLILTVLTPAFSFKVLLPCRRLSGVFLLPN